MPAHHVDRQLDAVFIDGQALNGRLAMEPADGRFQAFQGAHFRIRTLVNAGAAGGQHQAIHDGLAPLVGAGRGQLHNHGVTVLIGHDARQAIRFGMNQAQALLALEFRQGLTARHSLGDATLEEGVVDRLIGIEGPETGADLGLRAVGRTAQRTQIVGQHLDRITRPGTPFQTTDGTGKKPGMAVLEGGPLLARHENQLRHFLPLKCKKPRLPCDNRGRMKLGELLTQTLTVTGVAFGSVDDLEHGLAVALEQALGRLGNTATLEGGTTVTVDGHDNSWNSGFFRNR